jgi:hypothetical protein
MRTVRLCRLFTLVAMAAGSATAVAAQESGPTTREALIEQAQAEKSKKLQPYVPNKAEKFVDRLEDILVNGTPTWHPFWDSGYKGGGFAVGLGYMKHVSGYNFLDVRGSYSLLNYKLAEAEFVAPHLFHRRGKLSLLGGWREATQVAFYGFGTDSAKSNRTNYAFKQPFGSAVLTLWPARRVFMLRGGADVAEWSMEGASGSFPPVDTRYTPATLPGLGNRTTFIHSHGTVGIDWRTADDYSRRGGFYGVTVHDYTDRDDQFGFQKVDYEVIQHLPILREAWVISLRAFAQTTSNKSGQQIPFFMLPSVGGGSSLRGYPSWRFRDENSLLLQAEWRIMANRFLDTAVFYDAGKVAAHKSDLDLNGMKHDVGFGVRFHSPISTPLRVEIARGREGFIFNLSTSSAF